VQPLQSRSGLGVTGGYGGMVGRRPDTASTVEAKYPAIRFKQQLTTYVKKICGIIRDNLKKEISPFLTLCIELQQTSHSVMRQYSSLIVVANLHRLQELIA
jgi:myosin-5